MVGVRGAQVSRVGTSPGIDSGRAMVCGANQVGVGERVPTRCEHRAGDVLSALLALSTANLRELMRAALPVAHLTPVEAALAVVKWLVRRARSIGSRLGAQTGRIDSS